MEKVYLEIGSQRSFAVALDWPGWCRSGADETTALQALLNYAPRYARAIQSSQVEFPAPTNVSALEVVERLKGDATTDFGAPAAIPLVDAIPLEDTELPRLLKILHACWQAFDDSWQAAAGRELRKGPRGGGRELEKIVWHTLESETAYLNQLGWKFKYASGGELEDTLKQLREAVLSGLTASAQGQIPPFGPRGGRRWSARTHVRRSAWHLLDHAWEIEDRILPL